MLRVLTRLGVAALGLALAAAAPLSPQDQKFQDFIHDFRAQATAQGVKGSTYDLAFAHVARNQRVEELNLNQPEFSRAIWSYLDSAVSDKRVADGRAALAANLQTLSAIEARFGVPKEIVDRVSAEARKALADPAMQAKLAEQGIVAVGSTPEEFRAFVGEEITNWKKVITDAGIKME